MAKQTILYDRHVALGARMVDFAGWDMPVQYTGIVEEHRAVRTAAGLFDVSHMGEIWVTGPDAVPAVNRLITNSMATLQDGQVLYSPMCNAKGGTVDDILIYKYNHERLLLVVNASNADKDFAHIAANLHGDAHAVNDSDQFGQLALQGPLAQDIFQSLTDFDIASLRFFRFTEIMLGDIPLLVSRTGYTGEDGLELYTPTAYTSALWDAVLQAGKGKVSPIGLGARDTLRLEAALPLYGHELADDITPLEAGLSRFVKLDAGDFIGREGIVKGTRKAVGFKLTDRGVPRAGYPVALAGCVVGHVTSGGVAPSLDATIGIALVEEHFDSSTLDIVIRDKPVAAEICPLPFYKKKYKKQ